MGLALKKTSLAMLALLSVLPAVVSALNTTVTLTADATAGTTVVPTNSEVVTFGLPLVVGDVTDIAQIRVRIGGVEQLASIEAGLIWHWSDNSLRSVTIQLQGIDMTGGDITVTIDDAGNSGTQAFVPHSNGWELGPANKANMPFPRIFALHDLDYLASTSLIPPYLPGSSSEGVGKLQFDQFDNGYGGLDFSDGPGAQAAFLFDRATAMIKVYMTTGEVKFLKEGFMTKQLYYTHVRDDGTAPAPPGGDGCWTFGNVACADGKYIYTEPAKLAWALFGDNSQWDNALIVDMATQADLGFNQPLTSDPYDVEGEAFTERAAGIVGLAEINAYEITGDVGVLATMNSRLDSLKDMQQVEHTWDTNNGWIPRSGAFTHSWLVHEIDAPAYPGDGTTNDRRFSPWMSENIVDFLWQVYHVFEIDDTDLTLTVADLGEMLRLLGNAIDLYGFTSEYQSGLGLDASYATKAGLTTISMSCTAPDNVPVSLLYSGSSVATAAAIAATAAADGGFADQHNVETILSLGLAFYFETDIATRSRLFSRIQHLEEQWLRNGASDPENCAEVFFAGAIRLFNWQHRSNSVRTWDWILGEVGGIYDVKPNSFSFTDQTDQDPAMDVTSNAVTVAGLGTGASANVSVDTGTLVINGVDCASSHCTVQNTDTLAIKVTSAGPSLGVVTSTLTIGTFSTTFSVTTRVIMLEYPGWVFVAPSGCTDGQSWHFQCTGLWVDGADFDSYPIIATCTVTDGLTCANTGVNRRWTSVANLTLTTNISSCSVEPADLGNKNSCAAADHRFVPSGTPEINNPDAFSFTTQIELATSFEVTSNGVTIAGLGAGVNADASTNIGILVINTVDCGGPCTVTNGDTLAVKLTSSHLTGTTVSATVTVGAFSTDFDATTSGPTPDTTPDSFLFPAQIDLDTSIAVTSAAVTINNLGAGIDTPTSTDNGTLVIDGVDCTMNCLIMNGETLAVRITTSAAGSTTVSANVTVGTFSTAFDATTAIGLAAAPGTLSFTAVNNAALNQSHDSNAIVFNWLNVNTGVTTTAGILLINGTPCVAACTVDLNDTIALRLSSAVTNVTLVSATVTVDGISGAFNITTQAAASAGGSDTSLITGNVSNVVVTAGQLVTNRGVINSVELAAGSTVDGGTVTGAITGSGTLKNARIDATSIDPSVIVGQGSTVTSSTVSNVSGLVLTDALRDEQGMLQLSQPLVVEDDGSELSVLDIAKAAIDELFGNENTDFSNGTDDGTVELSNPDIEDLVVPIAPISVETTDEPDSVSIANAHGEFIIISNGIKTTFMPAAADLAAFQAGIDASGAVSDLLSDGSVSIQFNGSSFSLRFSLVASLPPSSPISIAALTTGEATFSEQGTLSDPATYRVLIHYPDGITQEVLPAIHDINVFDAWLAAGGFAAIINGLDGTILFQDRGFLVTKDVDVWRGIPSYGLLPPVPAAPGSVDFLSTTDLNGDGIGDIYFDTDTSRQVIYGLPLN